MMQATLHCSKRNETIDLIKGIACILVVFMHCEFPGKLGIIVQCVSRFAVPFFFAVSGFFLAAKIYDKKYLRRKIRELLLLSGNVLVLYSLIEIVDALLFQEGIKTLIEKLTSLTIIDWLSFVVFNEPVIIIASSWFLFALLYCYLIVEFLGNKLIEKLNPYIILGGGVYTSVSGTRIMVIRLPDSELVV